MQCFSEIILQYFCNVSMLYGKCHPRFFYLTSSPTLQLRIRDRRDSRICPSSRGVAWGQVSFLSNAETLLPEFPRSLLALSLDFRACTGKNESHVRRHACMDAYTHCRKARLMRGDPINMTIAAAHADIN